MTVSIDLAREGFRRAPSHDEKVIEAGLLLKRAEAGNITAIATLREAFSTSDFPVLLGQGLQATAITAYKDTPKEFEDVVFDTTVPDFNRRRLVDLWGADEFERVHEGEEYKGSSKKTTDLEHGLGKYGKVAKITWELFLDRRFSDIADFPRDLAQGAIKTQNSAVADLLVKNGAWNADFFKSVSNLPLTPRTTSRRPSTSSPSARTTATSSWTCPACTWCTVPRSGPRCRRCSCTWRRWRSPPPTAPSRRSRSRTTRSATW